MSTYNLTGKVAVITAGAMGIGEGCAIQLARMGADIAIGDINKESGERVVEQIQALDRRATFIKADMFSVDEAEALVEKAASELGGVDILINNVGGVRPRPFAEQKERNWRRLIDLNLVSMFAATKAAVPLLTRGGAIVNVASTEAMRAAPGFSVYAACKAAMVQFTKTMALELAPKGVRVNCIAPDLIDTPGLSPHLDPSAEAEAIRNRHVPLGRMASIEEAGAVVAFLASDMSSFVTGVTIPVDGGITAAGGWNISEDGNWQLYP